LHVAVAVGVGVIVGVAERVMEVVGVPDGLEVIVREHEGAASRPDTVQAEGQEQGKQVAIEVAPRVVLKVPASQSVQAEAPEEE
jgi:hypothetical protein